MSLLYLRNVVVEEREEDLELPYSRRLGDVAVGLLSLHKLGKFLWVHCRHLTAGNRKSEFKQNIL